MDLSKLSPAPLDENCFVQVGEPGRCWAQTPYRASPVEVRADIMFFALARQAFEVMVRRGWNPTRRPDGQWIVQEADGSIRSKGSGGWPDPYTALVEADAWYREHVEK